MDGGEGSTTAAVRSIRWPRPDFSHRDRATSWRSMAARLLSDIPLVGQVNLLTTGVVRQPAATGLRRDAGARRGAGVDWIVGRPPRRLVGAGRDDAGRRRLVDGVGGVCDPRAGAARLRHRHVVLAAALRRVEPGGAGRRGRRQPLRGRAVRASTRGRSAATCRCYTAGAMRSTAISRIRCSARAPPDDRADWLVRFSLGASRPRVAPGAEEFVPSMVAGTWLPPERTFAPITGTTLRAGADATTSTCQPSTTSRRHDAGGVRSFYQQTEDQLVTLFGLGSVERPCGRPRALLRRLGRRRERARLDGQRPSGRSRSGCAGRSTTPCHDREWQETPQSDIVSLRLPGVARTRSRSGSRT